MAPKARVELLPRTARRTSSNTPETSSSGSSEKPSSAHAEAAPGATRDARRRAPTHAVARDKQSHSANLTDFVENDGPGVEMELVGHGNDRTGKRNSEPLASLRETRNHGNPESGTVRHAEEHE